nr:hypothetical protein B0A51_12078 [Rachicladosporium sp. CCFEE 5018]
MAFNSDDHIDHAALQAQQDASRQKFADRNQWMTDNILKEARIQNKAANTKFTLGLEDHGASAAWNARVDLWWFRYESTLSKAYVNDPRGDMSNNPSGDGISLVLSTFAAQLRSRDRNQSGDLEPVMLSTIQCGFLALMSKFTIKYPNWKLTACERRLIRNMFGRLVKQGIVRSERSQRLCSSLPLRSVNILIRRYLVRALNDGVRSPDGLVHDLLIFTLLCATGARAGDLASVKGEAAFGSHCILMEDIVLQVAGRDPNPGWADVRCQITVKWFKTNSLQTRAPQVHRLSALHEDQAVIDPLVWLIVHCRQRNLLPIGSSLQTILNQAAARGDRRIVFSSASARQPLLLRLPPNEVGGSAVGAHASPAASEFLGSRITQIGFLAGALQPLGGHSLRRGVAEDLLALGIQWTTGADVAASVALGHGDKSQRKGLTSYYADNAVTGLLNARSDKLLTPITSNTLEYDDGLTKRTPITAQAPTLEDERERGWLYNQVMDKLMSHQPHVSRQNLASQARSDAMRLNREAHLAGMSLRAYFGQKLAPQHSNGMEIASPSMTPDADASAEGTLTWDQHEPSAVVSEEDISAFLADNNIGSGLALANVPAVADVNTLCDDVLQDSGPDLSQLPLAAAHTEDAGHPTIEVGGVSHEVLSMKVPELVQFFTSYNIIKKARNQTSLDLANYRRVGKNPPQFMLYKCIKGCGYSSDDWYQVLTEHECKSDKVVRTFQPRRKDEISGPVLTRSNATIAEDGQLAREFLPTKRTHAMVEGVPIPQSDSPNAGAAEGPQQKRVALPTMARCPEPGCLVKAFTVQTALRLHLRTRKHGYSNEESAAKAREVWENAGSPGYLLVPQ